MAGGKWVPASGLDALATRSSQDALARKLRSSDESDYVVDGTRRLLLRSPDGTYWTITVTNAGALVTTAAGSTL